VPRHQEHDVDVAGNRIRLLGIANANFENADLAKNVCALV
jgi:hypothetical protein